VRFQSLTIVCSWWIKSGPHLRPVLTIDGAATHPILGGTLIIAVTLTAANNIMPLGLLFTSTESSATVGPFLAIMRRLFPHQHFVISDSGTAFESAVAASNFECHGGCSFHVHLKNARAQVKCSVLHCSLTSWIVCGSSTCAPEETRSVGDGWHSGRLCPCAGIGACHEA
jgi:hypothetical protein